MSKTQALRHSRARKRRRIAKRLRRRVAKYAQERFEAHEARLLQAGGVDETPEEPV